MDRKQELLQLAKEGKPRPVAGSAIAQCLFKYTSARNSCYDAEFSNQIRSMTPNWGWRYPERDRQTLLDMAKRGDERPKNKTTLAHKLANYTTVTSVSYNRALTRKLKKLAPHWWRDTVKEKKQQLLELARSGGDKPKGSVSLNVALYRYTTKGRPQYDAVFREKLRRLAPHWFRDQVAYKKELILDMALNKKPKPKAGQFLRSPLDMYISPSSHSYDYKFRSKLMRVAPDWFSFRKREYVK